MKDDSAIVRSISGIEVSQRSSDGYVNATQLLQAHKAKTGENQKIAKWLETDRAKAYLDAVSKSRKILHFDLVQTKPGKGGGSWIHPDLVSAFATWLSIDFELQVSDWVQQFMRTGQNPVKAQPTREEIIRSIIPKEMWTEEMEESDRAFRSETEDVPLRVSSQFIYLIEAGDNQFLKIGFTKNPGKRLSTLQSGNPLTLCIVSLVKGDKQLEARLHKKFAKGKVRGEWFLYSVAIVNEFKNLKKLEVLHDY